MNRDYRDYPASIWDAIGDVDQGICCAALGGVVWDFMSHLTPAQLLAAMDSAALETLRAIREAESYNGPSIVICYCPCIEHGMKASMGLSQLEEKKAVECGYWHLYRYDPRLKAEGKNPFTLDSKAPTGDFQQFLLGENRYASLQLSFPEKAQELYEKAARDARERYESYLRLAEG